MKVGISGIDSSTFGAIVVGHVFERAFRQNDEKPLIIVFLCRFGGGGRFCAESRVEYLRTDGDRFGFLAVSIIAPRSLDVLNHPEQHVIKLASEVFNSAFASWTKFVSSCVDVPRAAGIGFTQHLVPILTFYVDNVLL